MKAIKTSEEQFECLIRDAIFYQDSSFDTIAGNPIDGFVIGAKEEIAAILGNGCNELYSLLDDENEEFCVLAGETGWRGKTI
jgi:hypothetical protein